MPSQSRPRAPQETLPSIEVVTAEPQDLAILAPLVMEFHAHEGIHVDTQQRNRALNEALAPNGPARILLALDKGRIIGYAIVGFGFSIEFGGRDAFLDELFVEKASRGTGIGQQLLAAAEATAKAAGARAMHLEAAHANQRGAALYRRMGYKDHARHLMTKMLA